jgi:hypothetical protein
VTDPRSAPLPPSFPQVSRNYTLLSDMDAEDASAPLLYTDLAQDSHFFRSDTHYGWTGRVGWV